MTDKQNQTHENEIVVLDTFTAIRRSPQMYVSQVKPIDDIIPLIRNYKISKVDKTWSPGFIHLFIEILENAVDEAKRCKGKFKNIDVIINSDTNRITITDEGNGFHNAAEIHKKTKKNVVRTALEELNAGSNFKDTSTNILGTYGIGAAVVNILSQEFEVITINKTHYVNIQWKDYKVIKEEIRKKKGNEKCGTTISFIPSDEVFPSIKWDIDIISSLLSYKNFLLKSELVINNLSINAFIIKDGIKSPLELIQNFIPEERIEIKTKIGVLYIWNSFENSSSISFINGSRCTGIHQRIINDWCNEFFKFNLAHHFYETFLALNVPSDLLRFNDQIKSRYSITRNEIEELLEANFKRKLIPLLSSSIVSKHVYEKIDEKQTLENLAKIRKSQKTSKRKISDKYKAPSKQKVNLYITEGASALGSISQARNPETDGIYALKGKIKNPKKLSDLSENKELLDLINILDLEPQAKRKPSYQRIIITTDKDFDGSHISSLLINFFNTWFKYIIEDGYLHIMITPLVVCTYNSKRKYFDLLQEFYKFIETNKVTNIIYLKGLGSMSKEDWEVAMTDLRLFKVSLDKTSDHFLDIAFGESSQKRKKWLQS